MIHFAGLDVHIGPLVRQRCAWCGVLLIDVDERNIATTGEPAGFPVWATGALVCVHGEGAVTHVIPMDQWPDSEDRPGEKALPAGTCHDLPPEATT